MADEGSGMGTLTSLASMIPVVGGAVSGVLGMLSSNNLADEERKLKLTMPPEMLKAEGMARELASMGLPGYEKYREDINQITPTTVNQAQQVAQSPSQLIDLMSRSHTATNQALRDLEVRDTQQNVQNKQNYQNFLGQKGQMALGIQGGNNQTELMALQQEAQGTKDLFQSLNNAIGSGINTYSTLSMLDSQKKYYQGMVDSWKDTSAPQGLAPQTPGFATFEDNPTQSMYPGFNYKPQGGQSLSITPQGTNYKGSQGLVDPMRPFYFNQ